MACATLGSIPHECATGMAFILLIWSCSCACWNYKLVAAQVHTATASDDPALQLLAEQRSILNTFKQHVVVDPNGVLASWNASREVCDWTGVECAPAAGSRRQVIALNLPGQGLSGTITPLLFYLQSLTYLNLSGNSFEGTFPDVGQAGNGSTGARLVSLDLSVNRLSGALPSSICIDTLSKLQTFWLQVNDFWGPIPSALGRCNELVELRLGIASDGKSRGQLNGTIPDSLANCSSLSVLRLSYSNLRGRIPEWLGSAVTKLSILNLAGNQLTGTIPASLGNLTGLTLLYLVDNDGLLGEVPVQLGSCNKLVQLALGISNPTVVARNGIDGTFATLYDTVLSNMTFLEVLRISRTQVTGAIPHDFATFKSLIYLDLQANFLHGEIPPSMGNLTNVEYVDLTYNDFEGPIPREFGLCTRLAKFYVGTSSDLGLTRLSPSASNVISGTYVKNNMIGSIQVEMGHLPFLREFQVGNTYIGRMIPDSSNATTLICLILNSNELEGIITTAHMPTSLQYLSLSSNHLTGPIPSSIGNLSSLLIVIMHSNDFEGPIPHEFALCSKLELLALGGSSTLRGQGKNMITGSIPKELGQLVQLQQFHLTSTYVTCTIPSSFGNLTAMISFYASDNELYGGLPTWLSNFTSLQALDVTTNKFDGSLCVVDWSKLQSLVLLYLFRNRFSGHIPSSLGMVTNLVVLLASQTNLTGTLPLSLRNNSVLTSVDFQSNGLSGNISDALDVLADTADGRRIQVIMLSSNMFQGTIPTWISIGFKNLWILLLIGNVLQGSIPFALSQLPMLQQGLEATSTSLWTFRRLNQVTNPLVQITLKNVTTGLYGIPYSYSIVDLSNNHLEGGIPLELSQLVGLRFLNLSRNHLSGSIPPTFSNMTSLIQLDVSNNDLSGSIPGMLASLDNLDYVDFLFNKLVGRIPFGTKYSITTYVGNPGLCGGILLDSCSTPPSPSPSNQGLAQVQTG